MNWIPCGNPMCIMVAGHPGPCYTTASGGGSIGGVLPWPDPRNAEIARLTAERDDARAEVVVLRREREGWGEKRQNEVENLRRAEWLAGWRAGVAAAAKVCEDTIYPAHMAAEDIRAMSPPEEPKWRLAATNDLGFRRGGASPPEEPPGVRCARCRGEGLSQVNGGGFVAIGTCPACGGTGQRGGT